MCRSYIFSKGGGVSAVLHNIKKGSSTAGNTLCYMGNEVKLAHESVKNLIDDPF